ncbi:hypothetical protein [Streptosporangium canum]|uniref:hypothetical protein n=1 Tax=Streptosporangium canum TaxID=324952 RepID=UPI0037AEF87A
MSRSTQIRHLVADLEKAADVPVDAAYGERGRRWELSWSNGPTPDTMKTHLTKLAQRAGLDPALFDLSRIVQDNALALQAVRYLRAAPTGEDPYAYESALAWEIERAARDTDHPDRPLDEREAALAARLLAAEGGYTTPRSLADRLLGEGLAALLDDGLEQERPGERAWAAEYLTARYAATLTTPHAAGPADHAQAWRRHLLTAPPGALLAAAAADPDAPAAVRLAALTLAPAVRAELEAALAEADAAELGLITALRADGSAWAQIGRALGTTRQGAAQRADRLTARTPPPPVNASLTGR